MDADSRRGVMKGAVACALSIILWTVHQMFHEEDISKGLTFQKGENSEGHGLGFSVCSDLARQYGLDLAVRSVPGRGTLFRQFGEWQWWRILLLSAVIPNPGKGWQNA